MSDDARANVRVVPRPIGIVSRLLASLVLSYRLLLAAVARIDGASGMSDEPPKNPLHGITLKEIVTDLVERRGFANLAVHIDIRCFAIDPSIRSSLKFLRKTDWARAKVEALYLRDQRDIARKKERNRARAARRAFAVGQGGDAEQDATSSARDATGQDVPGISE